MLSPTPSPCSYSVLHVVAELLSSADFIYVLLMFFSTELLSKRESGIGLLWLAATLGPKSSFKKLPKRSVLTANISTLCNLIVEPSEPLALRLSSNLMVGVVRVYKVKQEMFMSDVSTCYNSLKKAVDDLHTSGTETVIQLQMGQPSVSKSALTLAADPLGAFSLDFQDLSNAWTNEMDVESNMHGSDDYEFVGGQKKKRAKAKPQSISFAENPRANLHTLAEDHEHLLSTSLDLSFAGSGRGDAFGPSSSQADGGFSFLDDNLFDAGADIGLGDDLGQQLAEELGEGWGLPISRVDEQQMYFDQPMDMGAEAFDAGPEFPLDDAGVRLPEEPTGSVLGSGRGITPAKQPRVGSDKENLPPSSLPGSIQLVATPEPSTALQNPVLQQGEGSLGPNEEKIIGRKPKRVRLLLDPRTELTDEELKSSRTDYLAQQEAVRRELERKRLEKDGGKFLEEMIWGVPDAFQATPLKNLWTENFKVQVEARTGAIQIHFDDVVEGPPAKRRRVTKTPPPQDQPDQDFNFNWNDAPIQDVGPDMDLDMEYAREPHDSRMRSSEEPGQGRNASRPASFIGSITGLGLGQDQRISDSQRSFFAPWDDAGGSSSAPGVPGSFRGSIDRADVSLRRSLSQERRESSLLRNHGVLMSPGMEFAGGGSQFQAIDDFLLDVPDDRNVADETQETDMNLVSLERRSYKFLMYAKMQQQALPAAASSLRFDDIIVPKARKVAAEGFYHCLVLATKDLLHVEQPVPYGPIAITID